VRVLRATHCALQEQGLFRKAGSITALLLRAWCQQRCRPNGADLDRLATTAVLRSQSTHGPPSGRCCTSRPARHATVGTRAAGPLGQRRHGCANVIKRCTKQGRQRQAGMPPTPPHPRTNTVAPVENLPIPSSLLAKQNNPVLSRHGPPAGQLAAAAAAACTPAECEGTVVPATTGVQPTVSRQARPMQTPSAVQESTPAPPKRDPNPNGCAVTAVCTKSAASRAAHTNTL